MSESSYRAMQVEKLKRMANAPIYEARDDFLKFTQYTKPDYDTNWHHAIICDYLMRFVSGDIKRLMIFMPPRHGKSELVSRRLPAFILGQKPASQIIATSYGAALARRMNRDVQRIMDTPKYKDVFPNTKLSELNIRTVSQGSWLRNSDMFEVVNHGGVYVAAGVGGAIGGMGMDYGIIDDPYKNRQDANSVIVRRGVWDWYVGTFRDRLAPNGGILITTTLWSESGLAYELLRMANENENADQWVVLRFPAEYDDRMPSNLKSSTIDCDNRTIPGKPLWPNRFPTKALDATKASIGVYEWNAKFQQDPAPRAGNMFKREWFKIKEHLPDGCKLVRYWDKAGSQDAGDYTAGVLMGEKNGRYYVIDVVMGQWAASEREKIIKQTTRADYAKYGMSANEYKIYVEQEPGSGGKESAENTIRNLTGYSVYADRPTGKKEIRAEPLEAQMSIGNVSLIMANWNHDYIDYMCAFPYGKIKDVTDASSGAFNKLVDVDKIISDFGLV
jgi:predicted phage terminase large subunit-like protein